MELYRLRKSTVIDLLKMGIGQIPITKRSHSIPPAIQLCSTLNILATRATLRKTGELLEFGNQTVHKLFLNIIHQLNNLADVFIRFPNPENLNTSCSILQIGSYSKRNRLYRWIVHNNYTTSN